MPIKATYVWKGIRVIIQIRLMPYSIYVIWMLIMLYHKETYCIHSLKIVFWIIPFEYCVPPIKHNIECISVMRNLLSTECLFVFWFTSIAFPELAFYQFGLR